MIFNQRQRELLRTLGADPSATDSELLAFFRTQGADVQAQVRALGQAPAPAGNAPQGDAAAPPAPRRIDQAAPSAAASTAGRVADGSDAPAAGAGDAPVASTAAGSTGGTPAPALRLAGDASATATATTPAPAADAADDLGYERRRCRAINETAAQYGLSSDWANRMIENGTSVRDAELFAHEASRQRQAAPVADVSGGTDLNLESLGIAFEDALTARTAGRVLEERRDAMGGFEAFVEDENGRPRARRMHERAREFSGGGFCEAFGRYLEAMGVDTRSMNRGDLARLALNRSRRMQLLSSVGGGMGHSTSDFDSILENTMNKRLRMRYMEFPPSWSIWARENPTIQDFKQVSITQFGALPTPPVVREGQEYSLATASDGKEVYSLGKYGQMYVLNWEALINDDLSAFSRLPDMHGAAAARLEDDLAYGILTANANLADGGALFNTTAVTTAGGHANLASSGTALSVTSLSAGRAAMRVQVGLASEPLNIFPSFLIVPAALETTAEQLINSTVDPSKSNETPNPFRSLTVVPQPRLDAASATAWYLAAAAAMIDTVEVGFLAGYRQPQVEQEDGFDSDVRKFKVRHVCAAKAIDFRGLYKNPGS